MFAASKRKRAISPQAIKIVDKGKKKVGNIEQQGKVRSKRLNKTTQGPEFINLDNDEQDEEMTTKMFLLEKDAQIKEWEEEWLIIQYYKNEHKYFKKIKGGLSLQKKMTKHYAKKNKLACAKIKEALLEIKKPKKTK